MTLRPETAARAIQCLLEGCSIRCTERLTGLNRNKIMRLLEIIGERCGRFLRKTAKSQVPLCTVRRNLRVGIFRDENPLIAHLCAILFANAPLLLATKDPPFVVLPVVPEQLDELSKVHIQPKDFSSSALGTRRGT